MTGTLAEKIIENHLVEGKITSGEEVGIRIDQALLQDATGTMACLQFEAIGIPRVKPLTVTYVDHNMLQTGFENADDHLFLQTFSAKHGMYFSKPGNGICHQVHLERFALPGKTLLGSDSHTPTSGAMGMIAVGTGGLDVAVAMGGGPYYFTMPKIVGVELTGRLRPWVTAKDVILEMLRRLSVKGGLGKIIEYYGEGVESLTVPQRSTICNMGAELGATTSLFPSDKVTLTYLKRQGREKGWKPLAPDPDARYDEKTRIDLDELEPLVACPGSPDNVKRVKEVEGVEVRQALIGSCNNSSYEELMTVAAILKGKKADPMVSFGVNPGSRQVLENITRTGALQTLVEAGARIGESACLGCIGMGQAPPSGGASVRSFNRNWPGRSGTLEDQVYLASPEVCVAAALKGRITDPRRLGRYPSVKAPPKFLIDDSMILPPAKNPEKTEILRGPNIKPLPLRGLVEEELRGEVLIKVGDNISTDAIMPAGAKILPLRSNIPAISEYVFAHLDPDFVKRAKEKGGGLIVGGSNYGQGSSREHAALAPMYLGVKAVFAKSFARIHKGNLVNFGILPLEFTDPTSYDGVGMGSRVEVSGVRGLLERGVEKIPVRIDGQRIELRSDLTRRQREIILAGGLLNYVKAKYSGKPRLS